MQLVRFYLQPRVVYSISSTGPDRTLTDACLSEKNVGDDPMNFNGVDETTVPQERDVAKLNLKKIFSFVEAIELLNTNRVKIGFKAET